MELKDGQGAPLHLFNLSDNLKEIIVNQTGSDDGYDDFLSHWWKAVVGTHGGILEGEDIIIISPTCCLMKSARTGSEITVDQFHCSDPDSPTRSRSMSGFPFPYRVSDVSIGPG